MCFAFGSLAIIGDVAFQAAQGGMSAKAFEIGFGVIMGSAYADCRMAELVEIPVGGILFPERVGLPVRKAGVAVGGEISPSRQGCLTAGHEERARRGVAARCQGPGEEGGRGTRAAHLTGVDT